MNGAGFNAAGQPVAAPARYAPPSQGVPGPNTPNAPDATPYPAGTTPPPAAIPSPTGAPTLQPVDENAIRENVRQGMQASIDAINANYANLISQEQTNGQERSGETRAIDARSGLAGSDFGAAAEAKTQQFNQQQIKALQDEQAAKIAAVQANIEDRASAQIENERQANLQKYNIDSSAYQKAQEDARNDLKTLASSGAKLDSLDPNQKAALLKQAGYSDPAMGEVIYNSMLPKAAQIDYKFEKLADGKGMFYGIDPTTGQLKTQYVDVPVPPNYDLVVNNGVAIMYDKTTGIARVVSGFAGGTGSAGPYVKGQNPTVDSWVENIGNGSAKFTDVPENLKNAVNVGLASTHGSADDILATTKQSLDELQQMVDQNHGFQAAVGAKNIFTNPLQALGITKNPISGTAAADFVAKLKQATNDVVLPNLKILHGLGRVTDREFQALQSAVTSLSTSESEDQFKKDLKTLIDGFNQAQQTSSTPTGGLDLSQFEK